MALGVTIGSLFVMFGVIPGLLASALASDPISVQFLLIANPIFAIAKLMDLRSIGEDPKIESVLLYGIPHTVVYSFLAVVMLGWTINTLNFAENEVKFMPKSKRKKAKENPIA